ncbi:RIP metalloprotease RseP [uncultured Desulfobacterium sp.]|uniref:Zinc metalloprotease n=1 Tax=uncultured Desulfobacterium sp. TaxID=201089 RepID=A0A445N237_9BACT|nr:RIP metalloprotease RseP [uncultured Desulfobacterium sp.]
MDMILNTIHLVQYYVLPFVVVLGIMIFFHELGHFLVAKYFGIKVLKFALGFGPPVVSKTIGETEYSIRYIPLGGFVKMLGEDIEDPDSPPEPRTPEEDARAFDKQHPIKRMAVVVAGPAFNIVLSLLMFCGIYIISGKDVILPEIGQVTDDSPAQRAGFIKGDLVASINGVEIRSWTELKDCVKDKTGMPLSFVVKRDGKFLELTVTPEETIIKNEFGEDIKSSLIGIVASNNQGKIELSPLDAIKEGFSETYRWIEMTILVVVKLFQGVVSIKTLGGPILIGQMTGELAQQNLSYLLPFMAVISINLGILNLFPIPILDGGLIVFLLLELAIGRPLSIKKRELAQKVGLFLLILLMVVVFYNDISRLIR